MFIRPKTTQDMFIICYNGKSYEVNHKNNKYYITINKQDYNISAFVDANGDFLTNQISTFIDTINTLTKPKKVKYYGEFYEKIDSMNYVVQSKWFDTAEQVEEWFETIDFIIDDFGQRIMCAEWDETADSYGDIDVYKEII